jgi:non-heme chloroperoxidase
MTMLRALKSARPAPATTTVAARDGTRLHWSQWGEGRPMLFLASANMPSPMWDYQRAAFAELGFACFAFDRRGHGQSDLAPGGYDFDTWADDVAAVIEALDLREVTLVSHSMGGGEIVRTLTRHGDSRIARIIMLAPTTPYLRQGADNPGGLPAAAFEALRAQWRSDFPQWISDNTDAFFAADTSAAFKQWGADLLRQIPVPVAIACNKAMEAADFRAEMREIKVPALIVHGDKDASAPLALTGTPSAALIPGCRFKLYEAAPHGLIYTHMQRLHEDMLQFIWES